MDFAAVLAIAVSLAMDAFAVSISCGCANSGGISWKRSFILAGFFGGFQLMMPVIGWVAGTMLSSVIESFSHIISFGLLAFIGGKMVWESLKSEEGCRDADEYFKPLSLLMLSVATSIDALAAGFTFAHLNTGIILPAMVTGGNNIHFKCRRNTCRIPHRSLCGSTCRDCRRNCADYNRYNNPFLTYSHSMVAGGLDVISYVTRPIPRTEFVISDEISRISFVSKG